jgi:hypothetical protein
VQPGGQRVGRQQPLVQRRGGDVGQHRPAGPHGQPGRGVHGTRPAADHVDPVHPLPGLDLRAGRQRAAVQRRGQLPGPADRRREPVLLAQHHQQPAEHPTDRRVRRGVGVRGVAGQQQPGRLAAEQLRGHPAGRQGQEPRGAQQFGGAQPPRQPHRAADRRERGEQRAQHQVAELVPVLAQPQPGLAVTGVVGVQAGRGLLAVAVQHRRGLAVRAGRVGQHGRGVGPLQTVLVQLQRAQHR